MIIRMDNGQIANIEQNKDNGIYLVDIRNIDGYVESAAILLTVNECLNWIAERDVKEV